MTKLNLFAQDGFTRKEKVLLRVDGFMIVLAESVVLDGFILVVISRFHILVLTNGFTLVLASWFHIG